MSRILAATPATLDRVLARLSPAPPRSAYDDGTLSLDDLLYGDGGAIFAQRLGGAQAAIALPQTTCEVFAAELLAELTARLEQAGHRVLHAVVPRPLPRCMGLFEQAGFHAVTDLLTFRKAIDPAEAVLPETLEFIPIARVDQQLAAIVEQTYEQSADMPELNGTRSLAETLDAAARAARIDPPLWWYARVAGEIVGVLQMAPDDDPATLELTYMGLLPEARGLGFGRELGQAAISVAAALGAEQLVLSCDARNSSAQRVYGQLGFRECERRGVWLKIRNSSPMP